MFVSSIKRIQRTDISEGIHFNQTISSKNCMFCHYWYFADGFKYQPYVCNRCHDFSMVVQNLSAFLYLTVKNVDYRCYIVAVNKNDAVNLLNNSYLRDKRVL